MARRWLTAKQTDHSGTGQMSCRCTNCGSRIVVPEGHGPRAPRYCSVVCRNEYQRKKAKRERERKRERRIFWLLTVPMFILGLSPAIVAFTMIADPDWWVDAYGGGVWESPDYVLLGFLIMLWWSLSSRKGK